MQKVFNLVYRGDKLVRVNSVKINRFNLAPLKLTIYRYVSTLENHDVSPSLSQRLINHEQLCTKQHVASSLNST